MELASEWGVSTCPCPFPCSLITGQTSATRLSPEAMSGVGPLLPWFFTNGSNFSWPMLRAGGARKKRRDVWNSLFWSPPSKVCCWGEMLLYFLPVPGFLLVTLQSHLLSLSSTSPSARLHPPSLFAATSLSPSFLCLFSLPTGFSTQSPLLLPSFIPHSASVYLPSPGSPWHIPVCFPIAGPMWSTSLGRPWIYTFIHQSLYRFFHPFHSVF